MRWCPYFHMFPDVEKILVNVEKILVFSHGAPMNEVVPIFSLLFYGFSSLRTNRTVLVLSHSGCRFTMFIFGFENPLLEPPHSLVDRLTDWLTDRLDY